MNDSERLCPMCSNPLFLWEQLGMCHPCRESDVSEFTDMLNLGRIGFRVREVVIEKLQAVRY